MQFNRSMLARQCSEQGVGSVHAESAAIVAVQVRPADAVQIRSGVDSIRISICWIDRLIFETIALCTLYCTDAADMTGKTKSVEIPGTLPTTGIKGY